MMTRAVLDGIFDRVIAITADKDAPFALLDVEDLAASVPTAVAAHGVREPGRAAVRAQ